MKKRLLIVALLAVASAQSFAASAATPIAPPANQAVAAGPVAPAAAQPSAKVKKIHTRKHAQRHAAAVPAAAVAAASDTPAQ